MILDSQTRIAVNLAAVRAFVAQLRRRLRLRRREFNICFVDDREIARLNAAYGGKPRPTDVLSFSWQETRGLRGASAPSGEFAGFLGDVVISVETARRNAHREGHSTRNEIRWLILHGVLHLLGHDHETDRGEMTALELSLRDRLGINRRTERRPAWEKARHPRN